MRTAHLPTVHLLLATTGCQYRGGGGGRYTYPLGIPITQVNLSPWVYLAPRYSYPHWYTYCPGYTYPHTYPLIPAPGMAYTYPWHIPTPARYLTPPPKYLSPPDLVSKIPTPSVKRQTPMKRLPSHN